MATSSQRNYVSTTDEIVEFALDLVGARNQGNGTLLADKDQARSTLNYVAQSLSARNILQLWTRERRNTLYVSDVSQTVLTDGTATYDLGRDVLDLLPGSVFVRRSSVDSPLLPMSYEEYAREGSKATEGMPTRYLLETNQAYTDTDSSRVIQGRLRVVLHPVPENSTDSLYYTCIKKLQDFDAATNDPDAPPVWMRCLIYGLASELAIKYGMPLEERQDLRGEYEREIERMRHHDTPRGSMRLTPRFT